MWIKLTAKTKSYIHIYNDIEHRKCVSSENHLGKGLEQYGCDKCEVFDFIESSKLTCEQHLAWN